MNQEPVTNFIAQPFSLWAMPPQLPELLRFHPSELQLHPELAAAPDGMGEEEFSTLCQDIAVHGVTQPLLCDRWLRVLDGRKRLEAMRSLHEADEPLIDVPVMITDEEPRSLIIRTLLARRHVSKGARAYLVWPLLAGEVAANKERTTGGSNLKKGKKSPETNSVGFRETRTLEEMATQYVMSVELLNQARQLHEKFALRKDLREQWEPAIVAGDVGLGAVLAGFAGREATAGTRRVDAPPVTLIARALKDLGNRWSHWGKLGAPEKELAADALIESALKWPEEIRTRLRAAL